MALHELGHVLHAKLSGGEVRRVDLHPLEFSQTWVEPNPHPLFVAWGGAAWGTALPVLATALMRHGSIGKVTRFFAGFCLIANGAYVAIGPFMRAGDGRDIARYGVPSLLLIVVGAIAVAAGLWTWHKLGSGVRGRSAPAT